MVDRSLLGAIAVTRFGLGARPGEIAEATADPHGYLLAQLAPAYAARPAVLPGSAERLNAAHAANEADAGTGAGAAFRTALANGELAERARLGAKTDAPFRERWVLFWLNHFALQANGWTEMLGGSFAREAIEPHLFGRFEDMLAAALRHPAMLMALDQVDSVGPGSPVGQASGRGLNENLAREALELHTLGADAGYGQADVVELAKALAGWTVGDPQADPAVRGRFQNDPARREPGARRLLGRAYAGEGAAEAMLRDLARRQETHARIARKVARHFVADEPPASLIGRLQHALDRSGGSLDALSRALVEAPEAWRPGRAKYKTPYEFLVSAHRALDVPPDDPLRLSDYAAASGHSALWASSANGVSDQADAWATSLGLVRRVDLARWLAERAGGAEPAVVAGQALGPLLTARTETVIRGADPKDGLALVLLSPEFLHR